MRLASLGAGMGVMASHSKITRGTDNNIMLVSLPGARTLLNGLVLAENVGVKVKHEDRIIFGNNSVFKCVIPNEAAIGVEVDWEVSERSGGGG